MDSGVEFETLRYSAAGRCAKVRRIEVEHVDGSSFVYVNDLEDISKYGDSAEYTREVKLRGDCSCNHGTPVGFGYWTPFVYEGNSPVGSSFLFTELLCSKRDQHPPSENTRSIPPTL